MLPVVPIAADENGIAIGILAKRGVPQVHEQWDSTAAYLERKIPGYSFRIVPLRFNEISAAVANREIDFILANPAMYVELEIKQHVARIATMKNRQLGRGVVEFGSTVITRADRTDIGTALDVRNRRIAAVDQSSLGGWLMAYREYLDAGIRIGDEADVLSFRGTHDQVVRDVASGEFDIGIVRTDTLERMAAERIIDLGDFRVLSFTDLDATPDVIGAGDGGQGNTFPFLRSTRLYPEWPIATLQHTNQRLAELVASALIEMPAGDPAARDAFVEGWTIPLNYQPIHECMQITQYGPYREYGRVTFRAVLGQYGFWILAIFFTVTSAATAAIMFFRRNRELETMRRHLSELVDIRTQDLARKADQLKRSLDEKQALLAEIHHRVKNNLQVISSLLNLQLEKIHDETDREIVRMLQLRVETMSLVHESFEALANAASMPVGDYIRSLGIQAIEKECGATANASIDFELDDVRMDLARAVPFGLIVCELLSNALRHGRQPDRDLRIRVMLHQDSSDSIQLTVSDNGPGFDAQRPSPSDAPLGLFLVDILVKQLHGDHQTRIEDLHGHSGTTAVVTIPGTVTSVPAETLTPR